MLKDFPFINNRGASVKVRSNIPYTCYNVITMTGLRVLYLKNPFLLYSLLRSINLDYKTIKELFSNYFNANFPKLYNEFISAFNQLNDDYKKLLVAKLLWFAYNCDQSVYQNILFSCPQFSLSFNDVFNQITSLNNVIDNITAIINKFYSQLLQENVSKEQFKEKYLEKKLINVLKEESEMNKNEVKWVIERQHNSNVWGDEVVRYDIGIAIPSLTIFKLGNIAIELKVINNHKTSIRTLQYQVSKYIEDLNVLSIIVIIISTNYINSIQKMIEEVSIKGCGKIVNSHILTL